MIAGLLLRVPSVGNFVVFDFFCLILAGSGKKGCVGLLVLGGERLLTLRFLKIFVCVFFLFHAISYLFPNKRIDL